MEIEMELYNTIFKTIINRYGWIGVHLLFEEMPEVLDEIIQKHKETVWRGVNKNWDFS